jgi:putative phage-type endonuclease
MVEQRSDEWFAQRLGKVTASRIKDVMAKTKSGPAATRKNYIMQLLCERLTGKKEESFQSAAMQRGTELEAIARGMYEGIEGVEVIESGFVDHPTIPNCGASPDGIVSGGGLIEIKCPNTAQHVEFLQTGEIDRGYILQMQFQMICTKQPWCDYLSYDDRLPDELAYKKVRVHFSLPLVSEITAEVTEFLKELDQLENEMKSLMRKI